MNQEKTFILLFDGACNLCSRMVLFLIKKDTRGKFKLISLQSETAQKLLKQLGLPGQGINSVVFIDGGKPYLKSTAVLKALYELGGIWKLSCVFNWVPLPLRDYLYSLIAKYRHLFFGKTKACSLPSYKLNQDNSLGM